MSSTTTQTSTIPTTATFKFTEPDTSADPRDSAYFSIPTPKTVRFQSLPIHDYRTTTALSKGPQGLMRHGFTVVNQTPALSGKSWFSESNIRNVYFPEVSSLVTNLTGASKVCFLNAVFRRNPNDDPPDGKHRHKAGEQDDSRVPKPEDGVPVIGAQALDQAATPARGVHCDFSSNGARATVRNVRADIIEAAEPAVRAEDQASANGTEYNGPRYALYSIWRPINTVKRDPLAVADLQTVAPEDCVECLGRQLGVHGDFNSGIYVVKPSERTAEQKWYWLPEQKPEEVLVIKLADSEAFGKEGKVIGGTRHGSPVIDGTDGEETRESVEVRVVAFWE